jgi:hypothetical protein
MTIPAFSIRKWKSFNLALAVALFSGGFASASAPTAATIHVSPQGDDLGDGSAIHPLATLRAAQRLVFESLNRGVAKITVSIEPGEYQLDQPLVFHPQDGAHTAAGEVTFAAAGGEVRISGGRRITGWKQQGNRWITKVTLDANNPPFRDLWVNGRRAIRARAPNDGYFRVDAAGPDKRTSIIDATGDLLSLAHPDQAEVAFLHDWSMSRVRLASIDPTTRNYRFKDTIGGDLKQFAISYFEPHPRYFIEGASELLDAPGEWLLEESSGTLSYIPREGEKLQTAEIIAPRLDQLLIVRSDGVRPVMNLNFSGFTFQYSRYELPPHGYAGVQSAWHERRRTADDHVDVLMQAAVVLDRTQNCEFNHCRFEHLAACGLQCIHDEGSRLNHCRFVDIGGDGILIGSSSKGDAAISHRDVVENSTIQNCGVTFSGAVGVWVGFASDVTVSHNELKRLPYSGVSVGWKWDDEPTPCQRNIVADNHIHDVMQVMSDGGGIYTLGRQPGTRLAGNVIHAIPPNVGLAQSNGMFLDQGTSELVVEGNTIYDVARAPIRFNMAGPNVLRGNRLAVPPGQEMIHCDATDRKQITLESNQEFPGNSWRPAPDDPALKNAGPR